MSEACVRLSGFSDGGDAHLMVSYFASETEGEEGFAVGIFTDELTTTMAVLISPEDFSVHLREGIFEGSFSETDGSVSSFRFTMVGDSFGVRISCPDGVEMSFFATHECYVALCEYVLAVSDGRRGVDV